VVRGQKIERMVLAGHWPLATVSLLGAIAAATRLEKLTAGCGASCIVSSSVVTTTENVGPFPGGEEEEALPGRASEELQLFNRGKKLTSAGALVIELLVQVRFSRLPCPDRDRSRISMHPGTQHTPK
jgi:hypothetical protein